MKTTTTGVISRYWAELGLPETLSPVSLGEGNTPLVHAQKISRLTKCDVFIKVEGNNPTGSFKDRGMTTAITCAADAGAQAVICASTGNTSASAAAYAAVANLVCVVLIPEGQIAKGKLAQAVVHGAQVIQIEGNFDDCLAVATDLSKNYAATLVNSTNPYRILGQQTAAWEIQDALGQMPDLHVLPVGNAGNITAYWAGFMSRAETNGQHRPPRMLGFQAAGAAPFVHGAPIQNPDTIATAIRIGNPASWDHANTAVTQSGGHIDCVTDEEILSAQRFLAAEEGIFVEPASAAGIAGLRAWHREGKLAPHQVITVTVTGHGLKDPQWATRDLNGETFAAKTLPGQSSAIASALRLPTL